MSSLANLAHMSLFAGLGAGTGWAYLALVRVHVQALFGTRRLLLPILFSFARAPIALGIFLAGAFYGQWTLGATLIGFLAARTVILRREENSA